MADPQHQFINTLDIDRDDGRLRLVRDIVAIANVGGGRITIGATDEGVGPGLAETLAAKLSHDRLAAAVDAFIAPDRLPLHVSQRATGNGGLVVEIDVPAPDHAPLVLTRAGVVETGGELRELFAKHSVPTRRGSRVQPAKRDDYRRWTEAAVADARAEVLARLTMMVEAPADARVRIVENDEVRDEATFLLSRSADLFTVRPERLLDGGDLVYLWLHRHSLRFDAVAEELLFQSALRKRSTLFLWLYTLQLPTNDVSRYIDRALDMPDRDKSDGARSMLQVTALLHDEDAYEKLRLALAAASYAHMREAAAEWPNARDALNSLGSPADERFMQAAETELVSQAETLLGSSGRRVARHVTSIGVELVRRRDSTPKLS